MKDREISGKEAIKRPEKGAPFSELYDSHWESALYYGEQIDNASTVDVVPVVRCKDCKYSEPSVYPQAVNCTVLSKAIREWVEGHGCPSTDLIMTVFEDHYCGWGKRREDGNP